MRKILKDFYYGNITPSEGDLAANSDLKRAMVKVTQCENPYSQMGADVVKREYGRKRAKVVPERLDR